MDSGNTSGCVIAFANQKGGAGKTTTTGAFSEALQRRGKSVLAIDLDPQGSLSFCMGADPSLPSAADLLEAGGAKGAPESYVQRPSYADLVCAGSQSATGSALDVRAREIATDTAGGQFRLAAALDAYRDRYDYILLDTPPNMEALTVNALVAADDVIVPVDGDVLSAKGFDVFYGYLGGVHRYFNPRLKIAGVLISQYRRGVKTAATFERGIRHMCANMPASTSDLEVPVFRTTVRYTDVVKRAHEQGIGVYDAVASAPGLARIDVDYDCAVDEYLEGRVGKEVANG